jgi:hypothetical protein
MQLVVNRGGRQSPLPPPPNAPGIQVDTSTSNRLKVKAYNAHELERGRPRGAVAYLLFWTLSRKEPVHLSGYTNTTYSSEPTVTLDFEFDQSGATVILCACWINVKGERSPLSKAVRVVVP